MINKNLPPVEFAQDSFIVSSPKEVEGSQYVIFPPSVDINLADGRHITRDGQTVSGAMRKFSGDLVDAGEVPGITHGYSITSLEAAVSGQYLGGYDIAVPDRAMNEVDWPKVTVPTEMGELITSCAQVALQTGFECKDSTFRVLFGLVDPENDANRIVHSDGMGLTAPEGTENVTGKRLRFVYSPDSSTLIYPDSNQILKSEYFHADPLGDGSDAQIVSEEVNEKDLFLKAPQRAIVNESNELKIDAQQVMPGMILAFDPSRTFWHQSPESNGTRFTMVIDVDFMKHDGPAEIKTADV